MTKAVSSHNRSTDPPQGILDSHHLQEGTPNTTPPLLNFGDFFNPLIQEILDDPSLIVSKYSLNPDFPWLQDLNSLYVNLRFHKDIDPKFRKLKDAELSAKHEKEARIREQQKIEEQRVKRRINLEKQAKELDIETNLYGNAFAKVWKETEGLDLEERFDKLLEREEEIKEGQKKEYEERLARFDELEKKLDGIRQRLDRLDEERSAENRILEEQRQIEVIARKITDSLLNRLCAIKDAFISFVSWIFCFLFTQEEEDSSR